MGETALATGLGMLDARDDSPHVAVTDAGLVAGDAGTDRVRLARCGLPDEIGVGDEGPDQADHVCSARGDHLLGRMRLVDAPAQHGRHPEIPPQLSGRH